METTTNKLQGHLLVGPEALGREECDEGISNLDHVIDDGLEEKLQTEKYFGRHAAWNFNGLVWFQDGRFHEEVWTYGSPQEIMSANTLDDLRTLVNDEYGWS